MKHIPFTLPTVTKNRLGTTLSLIAFGLITLLALGLSTSSAHAQSYPESTLYSFTGTNGDGATPLTSLINVNGTFYGTTQIGGTYSEGTIYSFDPATHAVTILYSFGSTTSDSQYPQGALTYDSVSGKVFGVTGGGGTTNNGTIYSFDLASHTVTVLYSFQGEFYGDGSGPIGALVDLNGILYGTTEGGGSSGNSTYGYGTVYSFDPQTRTETLLHLFKGRTSGDGYFPADGLAYDPSTGKLFGTTLYGGSHYSQSAIGGYGTIFSVDPSSHVLKTLYSFNPDNGTDGYYPQASLIALNGKLLGSTGYGGIGAGMLFSFDPSTSTETILYNFQGSIYGNHPLGALTYDNTARKLFGITLYGGDANGGNGFGTVYSFDPSTNVQKVLYSFQGSASEDGADPNAGLLDVNGTLYGTTGVGGTSTANNGFGYGTVFSLTPTPVVPTANDDYYTTNYKTTLTVPAPGILGNDDNGGSSPMTAVLYGKVSHGTLTLNSDGSFTYTPNAGFVGNDVFVYQAVNAIGQSNYAAVWITVQPTAPIAVNNSNLVKYNTPLTVPAPGVLGNDDNGGETPMTATLVANPAHGTVILSSNGSFTYTPNTGFVGTDSFTYQAVNTIGKSNIATATLTVQPVIPTAVNDAYTASYKTALTVAAPGVLANDNNGGSPSLTAKLISNVSHGTLALSSNGGFTYTPTGAYVGTDSFTYQITNSVGTGNIATVTITVNPVAPIAVNNSNIVKYETTFTVPAPGVLGNDDNGGSSPITASLVTTTSYGTLTLNSNGSFTYTPNAGFAGTDSFTYQAVNSVGKSNYATATLIVQPAAPTAVNDSYTTSYKTPLAVPAPGVLGNDDNGGIRPYTTIQMSHPAHGTADLASDGSFTYTPTGGYVGTDSFTYRVTNSIGQSNIATVTITVNPVAPIAVNNSNNVKQNTPFTVPAPGVLGNDDNGGSSPLTAVLVTTTTHGTLTLSSNGAFTYTPNPGFTGTDSFTYQAVNSVGTSNIASATLIVK